VCTGMCPAILAIQLGLSMSVNISPTPLTRRIRVRVMGGCNCTYTARSLPRGACSALRRPPDPTAAMADDAGPNTLHDAFG
jgi:hypothetical protein